MGFDARTTQIGNENAVVVAVSGELDMVGAAQLDPVVDELVGRVPVILDLNECSFIDSMGVRVVVRLSRASEDGDGAGVPGAVVAGRRSAVRHLLDLTGLDSRIPVFESRDRALEWLDGNDGLKPPFGDGIP